LLPGIAEPFSNSFVKGTESLLAQQDEKLAREEEFPPMLLEPLVEETPLLYRKWKRCAMTGFEVAEEKERDASRQQRREEREAAESVAAEAEMERQEEERIMEAEWVADSKPQQPFTLISPLLDSSVPMLSLIAALFLEA
jgi:hypothetical protein